MYDYSIWPFIDFFVSSIGKSEGDLFSSPGCVIEIDTLCRQKHIFQNTLVGQLAKGDPEAEMLCWRKKHGFVQDITKTHTCSIRNLFSIYVSI